MALSVSSYEIKIPNCKQIVLVNAKPGERVDYRLIIDNSPTQKPAVLDDDAPAYTTCLMELKVSNGGSEASLIPVDESHDVLDQETCLMIKRCIISYEQVREKEVEYAFKDGVYNEEVCVICQEGFEPGQICTETECKHLFHDECIDEWLELKDECPICRTKFTSFYWYDSSDECD